MCILFLGLISLCRPTSLSAYQEIVSGGGGWDDEDPYEFIRNEVRVCAEFFRKSFLNSDSPLESEVPSELATALCWNSILRAEILEIISSADSAEHSIRRAEFANHPISIGFFGHFNLWKSPAISLLQELLYPKSKRSLVSPKSEQEILAWLKDPEGGMWGGIIILDLEKEDTLGWYNSTNRRRPGTLYTDILRKELEGLSLDSRFMVILKTELGAEAAENLMKNQLAVGAVENHTVLTSYFNASVIEIGSSLPPACESLF